MAKDYEAYRKLENEYFKIKKELQQEHEKNKKITVEVSGLKDELKDLKPGKSSQRIKELKGRIVTLEQVVSDLHDQIYKLQQEKKQMLQYRSMVSQSDSKETENLTTRIKELEAKLSRKGTGKPRNNKTSDADVLKLRNEGKSIRAVCSITGMSTATVVKIIKSLNDR